MLTKVTIGVFGAMIASAVAALPLASPGEVGTRTQSADIIGANSLATKGDRLRIVGEGCERDAAQAECADIFGVPGWPVSLTYQRRIGENMSVAVRVPLRK
jgi:hypothetical protein